MLRQNSSSRSDAQPPNPPESFPPRQPRSLDIQRELNRLEEIILSSLRIPFTRRTLIDEEQLLTQLDRVWMNLPEALEEALQILHQKEEILRQAQACAQDIIKAAEYQAAQMLDETGILQQAQREANQIRTHTQQECEQLHSITQQECEQLRQQALGECEELRQDAESYAQALLADLEQQLAEMLRVTRNGREALVKNSQRQGSSPPSLSPGPLGGRSTSARKKSG